MSISFLKTTFF